MIDIQSFAAPAIKGAMREKTQKEAVAVLRNALEHADKSKLGDMLYIRELKLEQVSKHKVAFKANVGSFSMMGDDIYYKLKGVINLVKDKAKWAMKDFGVIPE